MLSLSTLKLCVYLILFISISSVKSFYSSNEIYSADPGVLIDEKIIVFDSYDFTNATITFYLDLSKNWTTSEPEFKEISNSDSAPKFYLTAFSAQKKDDHSLIYAFGGKIPNKGNISDLIATDGFYKIDVSTTPFSFSPLGSPLEARCCMSSVIDNKGKLYIWGGLTNRIDKTMYIFDTFGSRWKQILPSSGYVPDQRKVYSSTFLDGKIYYVGGAYRTDKVVDIREILIYDTSNEVSPWSLKTATNKTKISNRFAHSAVLEFPSLRNSSLDYNLYDYLITLNFETFGLSELNTLNEPSIADIPYYSTAIVYNNYMIVAFGAYGTKNPTRELVKLLDLSQKNYIWVDQYIFSIPTPPPPPPPNEQSQPNTALFPNIPVIVDQHNTTQAPFHHHNTAPLSHNIHGIVNQQSTTQVPFGYIYTHNDPRTSYVP
ncbi:806_t:CDS:2 [Ambispora gerdemannii]|uniref:806_t:CDS:1 n=1 Tax=Ambispora gerdemannii TaxID=144530 RepID=A0A9N8WIH4_9GLOM|nr:806_t:CDS:2 [Ambispora gerdemannii]